MNNTEKLAAFKAELAALLKKYDAQLEVRIDRYESDQNLELYMNSLSYNLGRHIRVCRQTRPPRLSVLR